MNLTQFDESFWQSLDTLVRTSKIIIDRPKGTAHPRYPDFIYPVDYGYLQGTLSMDGHGIDIWQGTSGTNEIDAMLCIVDLHKRDSEIKLLLSCTEREKQIIYEAQNDESMSAILLRRGVACPSGTNNPYPDHVI